MNTSPDLMYTDEAAAFEILPRRLLIVGRDGRIGAANAAMRRTAPRLGRGPVRLKEVFHGRQEDLTGDMIAAATVGTLVLRPRAPPEERIEFQVTPIREARRLEHLLLSEDRSRHVQRSFGRITADLHRANEDAARLRRAHSRLQDSYAGLERFSYTAAHDLKSPLRHIDGLLQALDEDHGGTLPRDARDMLDEARGAALRLQGLIADLLSHARSGAAALAPETVVIGDVLGAVRAELAGEIALAGTKIEVTGDLGRTRADRTLVFQLLANLVGNAVKYRAPGRPSRLAIRREDDRLVLADNGLGFDPADARRLFAPFERLHAGTGIEGSGVGLATCAMICDRHGWTLTAEGVAGQGATFVIGGLRNP